ncbi:MAG: hypothetical protein U5L95_04555 [Candidatus Saccharibacteria bacterium]|nr:hypothetical protein [Candidatus Saccharibacteria bacterium]
MLAGPSGIGKTYISKKLIELKPADFRHANIVTTRPKRTNEEHVAINRIFVSSEEYKKLKNEGSFFIDESFAGYNYGYRKQDFTSKNYNTLVDVSPCFLRNLSTTNTLFVGLSCSQDFLTKIEQRMTQRRDTTEIIKNRLPFVKRDLDDIERYSGFINNFGKVFNIADDREADEKIIPWILGNVPTGN